jgi:transposase
VKGHDIKLTGEQRAALLRLADDFGRVKHGRGKAPARKLTRAAILLLSDAGLGVASIEALLGVHKGTVYRTRRRFAEEGLAAVEERPRPGPRRHWRVLGAEGEARLVAEARREPPGGRWSLRLLARRAEELGLARSCSHETVRLLLRREGVSI